MCLLGTDNAQLRIQSLGVCVCVKLCLCLNHLLIYLFGIFPTDLLFMAMGFGDSEHTLVSVCILNSCAKEQK